MVLSEDTIIESTKRLLIARMRLLCNNGFYGLLLMHIKFSLDSDCKTAYTDGTRIAFNPVFLKGLSDSELDFVLMHEILHVVLQHCNRGGNRKSERYNIACDIVVNSNIFQSNDNNLKSISLNGHPSMHLTPNGEEGNKYTVEQVYEMLSDIIPDEADKINLPGSSEGDSGNKMDTSIRQKANDKKKKPGGGSWDESWDDHDKWDESEPDQKEVDLWIHRIKDACEAIEIRKSQKDYGSIPDFALRLVKELRRPQTDWRRILNEFIQQEITDYSFTPPDRRFDDGDFFLPDFNEKDDIVEDILFMIDTSGSMSDEMILQAYSEVKGAIDQFDGKLKGWLGFFDAAIIEPIPFSDVNEFKRIQPMGGGGTNFEIIFLYVQEHMQDKLPAGIIILTDGYAPFPKESEAMGIPVLWLLNNDEVAPPWGKVARIRIDQK